eukprot:12672929-Ditylum_brightwellii.AAC.1
MLMDKFESAKPGTATLDLLCRVCLYLGATTLADICDDNGKVILSWALTGRTHGSPASPWPIKKNCQSIAGGYGNNI